MMRVGTLLCFSAFLFMAPGVHAALDEELAALSAQVEGFKTDTGKLRKQYEELLERYTEPHDVGRIYAALANMYCQSGLTDPYSAAQYAQKALEYPLDNIDKLQLYFQWGDALQVQNRGVTGVALAKARREVVKPYLYGMKLALEQGIPEAAEPLPAVGKHDYSGVERSAIEEQLRKKHQAEVAARDKAKWVKKMVQNRDICVEQTVFLYSRKPYATDELLQLATEILQDKAAVDKLAMLVNAKIQERMDKELDEISKPIIDNTNLLAPKEESGTIEKTPENIAKIENVIPPQTPPAQPSRSTSPGSMILMMGIVLFAGAVAIVIIVLYQKQKRSKASRQGNG